jgi:hypothetical protein
MFMSGRSLGTRWIASTANYLLPVPVLASMFRGKIKTHCRTHLVGRRLGGDPSQVYPAKMAPDAKWTTDAAHGI